MYVHGVFLKEALCMVRYVATQVPHMIWPVIGYVYSRSTYLMPVATYRPWLYARVTQYSRIPMQQGIKEGQVLLKVPGGT